MWRVLGRILYRTLTYCSKVASLLWFSWESLLSSWGEVLHLCYRADQRPHIYWMVSMALSFLEGASSSNLQWDCHLWQLLGKRNLLGSYVSRLPGPAHQTMLHGIAQGYWTLQECSGSSLLEARRREEVGLSRDPGAGEIVLSTCRKYQRYDFWIQAGSEVQEA